VDFSVSIYGVLQRNFRKWAEKLVLQKSEEEQHFTGFVHLKGPVKVVDRFRSDWINGMNVSTLPETLVDKNAHQIVTGNQIKLCNMSLLKTFFHLP